MRRAPTPLALAVLLVAAGCVHETKLYPLPPTAAAPVVKGAAVAEAQGVRMLADGDAWHGNPGSLEHYVTPVFVQIENKSQRPLRIQYSLFELVGQSGFNYGAYNVFDTRNEGQGTPKPPDGSNRNEGQGPPPKPPDSSFHPASASSGVVTDASYGPYAAGYQAAGYQAAGYYGYYGSYGYGPWLGPPWSFGWGFYDPWFYPWPYYYYVEPLPTRDMLRRALPEGTLEPGGSISGFVYFQEVGREGTVKLRFRSVDAQSGETFGEVTIPFIVD